MATVEILPVSDPDGVTSYRALLRGRNGTQDKQSTGKTAGQALDALTAQLTPTNFTALLVIQNLEPDLFFSADQQKQLAALMEQWRVARDQGEDLPPEQQSELDELVEAELRAATARTTALMQQEIA